jgi:DNA-binding GntR family transcriptional regulator
MKAALADTTRTIPDRIFTERKEAIASGGLPTGAKFSEPGLARE